MVVAANINLSITVQCRLLSISRSSWYYNLKGESLLNLALMRLIDEQFLLTPYYGSRQMARHLRRQGYSVGRHRIRRLMRIMGLRAIYQEPRTSVPHPEHKIYPYLLRNLVVTRPNQVWCTDITYIPIKRGFLYLVAIIGQRYNVVQPQSAELASVQQHGREFLSGGPRRGFQPSWPAGDIQHGSGITIYLL